MRAWLLLAALVGPLAAVAAEAPAPPVINAPQAMTETAPVTAPLATPAAAPVSVSPPAAPAAPLMQPETTPVSVRVAAIDPAVALKAAFWPGVVLHGWGHHVAGDQDTFLNLAGGELFSVVMLGFGLAEALGPDVKGENKNTSQSIAMAGAAVFGITWAWDIFGAQAAAKRYNARLDLGLAPQNGGAQLALTRSF